MYYLCSENKGADQLRGIREADLRLCFRIYKMLGFFHDAAHIGFKWSIVFVCCCVCLVHNAQTVFHLCYKKTLRAVPELVMGGGQEAAKMFF